MSDEQLPASQQDMPEGYSRRDAKRRFVRLGLFLVVISILVTAGALVRWSEVAFTLFLLGPFVPRGFVMVLDGILLGVILKGYWRRWPELLLLVGLWLVQTAVLLAYGLQITAADAFWALPDRIPFSGGNIFGLVIDTHVQGTVMKVFWYGAGIVLLVVTSTMLARFGVAVFRKQKLQRGWVWRLATIGLLLIALGCLLGDAHQSLWMGVSLADTTSPDGRRDVRLVPINAFADINGVVMFRTTGSLWWYPMGTVGDELTFNWDRVRFVWDSDMQVRLLVGERVCGPYDLWTGRDISKLEPVQRVPRSFEFPIGPADLRKLEKAVIEDGHQPWRLDPVATAQSSLTDVLTSEYGIKPARASELTSEISEWVLSGNDDAWRRGNWVHGDLEVQVDLYNSQPTTEKGIWYCRRVVVRGRPTPE